jgi:cytochrome c biogenesis protein
LRYDGVTFYQTSWGIAGAKVQLNNSPIFQLPIAQLPTENKANLWGTWIPTKPDLSEGVSLIVKDLQGTAIVYNQKGELSGAVRVGQSIEVNGVNLKLIDLIGSTGLQIKADPGVPIVYTGFALLMMGVVMSYFSHSQIWALQQGDRFYIGGKTNRAQVTFERELIDILNNFKVQQKILTQS